MGCAGVRFSVAAQSAWAPGLETSAAWAVWANSSTIITGRNEPMVSRMSPMLRRRAGSLGKMALEVAYQCLGEDSNVPTVFCSRHGEVSRSIDLLSDLARGVPLSPTTFGLSVHNATGGLFSIARSDRANNSALAAGQSTVEHAVIEACGLLADGAPAVLLVAYECPLPSEYSSFEDNHEQPHAWAWLMRLAGDDAVSLTWSASAAIVDSSEPGAMPASLQILRFHLRGDSELKRVADGRLWHWTRHA
jgi:hypothetical protein